MKKYIYSIVALTVGLVGCNSFDEVAKNSLTESNVPAKTHTIKEFLNEHMSVRGDLFPVRTRSGGNGLDVPANIGLFSVDTIPSGGSDIIIRGRVITDDYAGNFYKSLVIQDSENHRQTIRISVDGGSISGRYPLGQLLNIRCNGLAVGKYANQPQLAIPSYNNNVNATSPNQKVGWAPGRIPLLLFNQAVTAIGMPEKSKVVVDTLTIAEILSAAPHELDGRLVCIKGVFFNQKYANTDGSLVDLTTGNPNTDTNANVFAPTTNNIGFPQSRAMQDQSGNWILISTSEYAKFAFTHIPATEFVGTVTGIVGFYRDNERYVARSTNWSISLRSLNDLKLVNSEGKSWTPIEWKE